MVVLRILPLVLAPFLGCQLLACSVLFGAKAEATDGGQPSDAEPVRVDANASYSLVPAWQFSTGRALGQVVVASPEELVFAGSFGLPVTLGGSTAEPEGRFDILLMRLERNGTFVEYASFGGADMEFVTGLTVSPQGRIVVAGGLGGANATAGGMVNFAAGSVTAPFVGFVATYTPGLTFSWALLFDSSNTPDTAVNGLDATSTHVLACGSFVSRLILTSTDNSGTYTFNDEGRNGFISQYDPQGVFAGDNQLPLLSKDTAQCSEVVAEGEGAMYVAGSYTESILLAGTETEARDGTESIFVAHNALAGASQWQVHLEGNTFLAPIMRGAAALSGDLVLATQFQGELEIPDLERVLFSEGDDDIALLRFDAMSGEVLGARSFPSSGASRANDVVVGPNGEIAVVGRFSGTIDFGGGALVETNPTDGETDAFIAVFSSDGEHLWSQSYGDSGVDSALSADFDEEGSLYVTFRFQNIEFGLGPLSGTNQGAIVKFEQR